MQPVPEVSGSKKELRSAASSHALGGEEVVVLNSVGSSTSSVTDSDASLGGIATAVSACCIIPREERATASLEPGQEPFSPYFCSGAEDFILSKAT